MGQLDERFRAAEELLLVKVQGEDVERPRKAVKELRSLAREGYAPIWASLDSASSLEWEFGEIIQWLNSCMAR